MPPKKADSKAKPKKKGGSGGPGKKVSEYNKYVKTELARLRALKPDTSHKDLFKQAAQNWRTAKENPKAAAQ